MKVSVCMITYNQEELIGQAIESVLMQKVVFDYELVIGEDCSTDQTRSILKDYQAEFPEKIRLLLNENNVGATRNFAMTLDACQGQYIALLEGDDYWTSPHKLQKQVDFLDSHPDYAICYHATQLVDRSGTPKVILPFPKFKKATSTLLDLIVDDSFMATCSTMFRARLFDYFPDAFFASRDGCDWCLNVLNAQHGPIGYIDEVMSVYRSGSSEFAWTSKPMSFIMGEAIKLNEAFNTHFDFKYDHIFKAKLARYYYTMAMDYLRQEEFKEAYRAMSQSVKKQLVLKLLFRAIFVDGPPNYLRGWLRNHMPGLYSHIKAVVRKQVQSSVQPPQL